MRYSNAFSSFEIICVVMIVAILVSFSMRYIGNIKEKSCIIALKSSLANTQRQLSQYYAKAFLSSRDIDSRVARDILTRLPNDVNCGFELQNSALIAYIGDKKLYFNIEPSSFAYNPRIFCALQDSLCKQMSDRILDK